jgi:hypothetical protein
MCLHAPCVLPCICMCIHMYHTIPYRPNTTFSQPFSKFLAMRMRVAWYSLSSVLGLIIGHVIYLGHIIILIYFDDTISSRVSNKYINTYCRIYTILPNIPHHPPSSYASIITIQIMPPNRCKMQLYT